VCETQPSSSPLVCTPPLPFPGFAVLPHPDFTVFSSQKPVVRPCPCPLSPSAGVYQSVRPKAQRGGVGLTKTEAPSAYHDVWKRAWLTKRETKSKKSETGLSLLPRSGTTRKGAWGRQGLQPTDKNRTGETVFPSTERICHPLGDSDSENEQERPRGPHPPSDHATRLTK
jgi:hypothetical protein